MNLLERRKLMASKMKPLSLYEAGWNKLQNCSIKNSQVYSFKSDYLQIGSGNSSEAAYGRLIFTNIANLNKYKKLCITYYTKYSSKTIKIGNLSSLDSFTSVQEGSLVYDADATVTFDINSSWNAVELFSRGRTSSILKIYKIWLEG